MTGVFDTLSSPDEVGFGNWRLVKNATTRATRNRQRAGGWRRLFADDEPYNNQDLHDQLVDRLGFYDSYVGHSSGGGDQSGYGYPYFAPSYQIPGFSVFPPASGPYCPVYIGDFPSGSYNGCPIFYPFVGYPYVYFDGTFDATGARAHWRLDSVSGTTPDAFGGLDLTDNGGSTVEAGVIDNALVFDSGSYLSSSSTQFQTGNILFGFTGWIKRSSADAGGDVVIGKWDGAGAREYRLDISGGKLRLSVSFDGTTLTDSVIDNLTLDLGDWVFFACWHDPAANTINIRTNGNTTVTSGYPFGVFAAGAGDFVIGRNQETPASTLRGSIDSVTFWKNEFPTESELDAMYNSSAGVDYPFTSQGACDTGSPFYYFHSSLYTSCPVAYDPALVAGYPYGYPFNTYYPSFAYDYVFCGDYLHLRQGCRESITMLNEIVVSDARKLIAATMSRVYELNQSSGSWRILVDGLGNAGYTADQCTCNAIRGVSSTMGSYLLFTNNIDPPMIYLLGDESSGCSLNAMSAITDLDALGISRAGGVIVWRGFAIWYDITEGGDRQSGTVIWSDLEDPNSYIESDTSFAGRATIAVGETILAAAPLGNWLVLYTDKSIIRVTLVGGKDVFNFERIYTGGNALKYKFSLVNGGDFHLYVGESDIYVFTQFDTRPITVPWITRAAGFMFNGIAEDDATYLPINKEACDLVTGGWSEEKHEAFISWPTGENICPDVTLRLNMKFGAADLVDHGFTAFLTFRKDERPTVGEWLEDMGICARGTQVAVGFKDGHVCDGDQDAVVDPPLYLRNPTEDPDLPIHADSLCAALGTRTLDDFCRDCAVRATFIAASAEDFTLKQLEDDIYYREMLRSFQTCGEIDFGNYYGQYLGFGSENTTVSLDEWISIDQFNCGSVTVIKIDKVSVNCEVVNVTGGSIDDGVFNTVYSYQLIATGGTAPYHWVLVSGGLPDGLSLSQSGIISGTPTTFGDFSFSVKAVDVFGNSCTQNFGLFIDLNPDLWLKADAIEGLSDGQNVVTWIDSSGNGHNATIGFGSADVNPVYRTGLLNGLPGVDFQVLAGLSVNSSTYAINSPNPFTVIAVIQSTSNTVANRRAIQSGANIENWMIGPYSGTWRMYNGNFIIGPAIDLNPHLVACTQNAAGASFYLDEALIGSNVPTNWIGIVGLGNNYIGEDFLGYVFELIVFSRILTSDEIGYVSDYLNVKWGL